MALAFENLRPGDESAADALGARSFGALSPPDPDRPRPPRDRVIAAYDGDRLMATTITLPMGQFFGGRSVPMGGLASVKVDPLDRGRGLAKRMVTEAFEAMRERGEHLSTLYPTTASLYGGLGYGIAGTWTSSRLDLGALGSRRPDGVTIEIASYDDTAVVDAYREAAATTAGWLDRPGLWWEQAAHDHRQRAGRAWLYRAMRDGRIIGALAFDHQESDTRLFDVRATDLHACHDDGLRALLSIVAGHGTTTGSFSTLLPLRLLARAVDQPQWISIQRQWPWMSRLVDAAGAIAARGYGPDVAVEVALAIHDPVLGHNDGHWVLVVRDGEGRLEPGGDGRAAIGIADLASLYTGWADPLELAAAGRLTGADESTIDGLRSAFAGPAPTLIDFF